MEDTTVPTQEAPKRDPKDIAKDLTDKAIALDAEWSTNVDHPKAIEAKTISSLLREAADALTPAKPKK
jgi:hypothetical protein